MLSAINYFISSRSFLYKFGGYSKYCIYCKGDYFINLLIFNNPIILILSIYLFYKAVQYILYITIYSVFEYVLFSNIWNKNALCHFSISAHMLYRIFENKLLSLFVLRAFYIQKRYISIIWLLPKHKIWLHKIHYTYRCTLFTHIILFLNPEYGPHWKPSENYY